MITDISSRKLAENAIHRHANRMEALVRVASRLNTNLEIDEVLRSTCEEVADALGLPFVQIYLVNENEQVLKSSDMINLNPGSGFQPVDIPIKIFSDLFTTTGAQVICTDSPLYPYIRGFTPISGSQTCNYIIAPIQNKDNLIGALNVMANENMEDLKEEISLLQILSNQTAVAIVNARLYEQVSAGGNAWCYYPVNSLMYKKRNVAY